MVVCGFAAPPTPLSKNLAEPKIDPAAYVHSFSNIIGDVYIGANVTIAPGTSIRADEGTPFCVGEGTSIQDGVVIHGLEKGRVVGDDGHDYSVWIGKNSSLTHMALIHGPAYVGDDCFIGFRSTIFNARVGNGCIVMMHALVQDVEILPGKLVPSGAIITSQQQADLLPEVGERDLAFAHHVVGTNDAFRMGGRRVEDAAVMPIRDDINRSDRLNGATHNNVTTMQLQTKQSKLDIAQQVRQLLSQGYRVGAEYADERHFRTSSWYSCASINSGNEASAISSLQACLAEHAGEYVRLIGIDTKTKRRVFEETIQRPGDAASQINAAPATSSYSSYSGSSSQNGRFEQDVVGQIRQLLAQGYRIGTEHADERRFRTSSWYTCAPIESNTESGVVSALEACLQEHSGEYVRLIGIDTKAKRRVVETIVQRPGDQPKSIASNSSRASSSYASASTVSYSQSIGTGSQNGKLTQDTISQVRQLLMQGYRVGTEHADERRFRTSSWHSCGPIESNNEAGVVSALEACLNEHNGEYVRLIGIDTKSKRRVVETVIQRPGSKNSAGASGSSSFSTSPSSQPASTSNYVQTSVTAAATSISQDVVKQIRQLLTQGHRIGAEHADERRFRTSSWYTCAPIEANTESGVIAALESSLNEYSGEYVRLYGIDTKSKRRVLEAIVQRPKK